MDVYARRSHFWGTILALPLLAAAILLFLASRGKWSDAIIDSGREWIVPDALARGELLYSDVVYWFGPFTPYFHSVFFRLLGSSFRTLVVAGVAGSLGILAALYMALRRVTGKVDAALWTAVAVPAFVFMPNSGGSILGMGFRMWHAAAFSLLAIAIAGRPSRRHPALAAVAAGALCALAALCRTEWGLAALAASLISIGVVQGFGRRFLRNAGLIVGAGLLIFAGTFAALTASSGLGVILSDAPVLLIGIPEVTRQNVLPSGLGWRGGVSPLLYSSSMWIGCYLLLEIAALGRQDPNRARRRVPLLFAVLMVLGVTGFRGGSSGAALFSAAPVVCVAGVFFGVRGVRGSRAAAPLAGYGLAGLLLSHRRLFNIADAPYVGPPLLFALCCAAALLRQVVASEGIFALRRGLRNGIRTGIAVLAVVAFAGRFLQYVSDNRVPVPGTGGMLSAYSETSREIADLASAVRRATKDGDGLVVFPEGEVLNFLSGRHNPTRHKLFLPGYVNRRNEAEIVRELERARPAAVVIWHRPTGEYGLAMFGESYGQAIRSWIDQNYILQPYLPPSRGRAQAVLALRRTS